MNCLFGEIIRSSNMKILVCFLVLSAVFSVNSLSLTPEQKVKVRRYHATCLGETKVDPSLVKKARKGQFVEDDALKNYAFCFLRKADLVSSEGKLNEEVMMAKLPPGANKMGAILVMEVCKTRTGKNPADSAFQLYKCYYETTPTHVSLF